MVFIPTILIFNTNSSLNTGENRDYLEVVEEVGFNINFSNESIYQKFFRRGF